MDWGGENVGGWWLCWVRMEKSETVREKFQEEAVKRARHIRLDSPVSLRDILAKRLWEARG